MFFTFGNIIIIILMIASFVGMIICAKKQYDMPLAKPGAIGLLIVVLLCTIFLIFHISPSTDRAYHEKQLEYSKSMTYVLGKELSKQMPEAKVLVVIRGKDIFREKGFEEKQREGLKEGFAVNGVTDIKFEAPQVKRREFKNEVEAFDHSVPFEELVTAKDIDRLIAMNKDRNLVIFMIGLPQDSVKIKFWKNVKKSPKIVLINPRSKIEAMRFVKEGIMPVFIFEKPNFDPDKSVSGTIQDYFDNRFVLVNTENIGKIVDKYPEIFREQ